MSSWWGQTHTYLYSPWSILITELPLGYSCLLSSKRQHIHKLCMGFAVVRFVVIMLLNLTRFALRCPSASGVTLKAQQWSFIYRKHLPKGPYPPCLPMADRDLLAGYPRYANIQNSATFGKTTYWDDYTIAPLPVGRIWWIWRYKPMNQIKSTI